MRWKIFFYTYYFKHVKNCIANNIHKLITYPVNKIILDTNDAPKIYFSVFYLNTKSELNTTDRVNLSLLQFHYNWFESNTRYRISRPELYDQSCKQVICHRIHGICFCGFAKEFSPFVNDVHQDLSPARNSLFLIPLRKIRGIKANSVSRIRNLWEYFSFFVDTSWTFFFSNTILPQGNWIR